MSADEASEMLEKIVAQLHEHFEAVQIMVSWNEEGESRCQRNGAGNWYARIGMAREMILFDDAQIAARELAKVINGEDDDS